MDGTTIFAIVAPTVGFVVGYLLSAFVHRNDDRRRP